MSNETSLSQEIKKVLRTGDLAQLTVEEKIAYYAEVCNSIGLNPLTQPLDYIQLNGKLRLYAKKDATDQLRRIYDISVEELKHDYRKEMELYICTASGQNKDGRHDVSTGAVNVSGLRGEAMANAIMKAETKAKRRLTLSLCGLGMLDETELETVPPEHLLPAPTAPVVPVVNQTPAEPTNTPRPNETVAGEPVKPETAPETKPKRGKKAEKTAEKSDPRLGITDEDIANAGTPRPVEPVQEGPTEGQKFAEDVCSATPKSDRIPDDELKAKYVARIRELVKTHGVSNKDLGAWVLKTSDKFASKELTVANWEDAFEKLDAAVAAGTLKELVKQ
jgi:hypothetical protein